MATTKRKTDAWKKSQRASQGQQNRKAAPGKTKPTGNNRNQKTRGNDEDETEETPRRGNRHFVGGGWDNSGKYGTFLNLQLNLDKLNQCEVDNYGNIRLTVAQRREEDEVSGQSLMIYEKEA